MRLLDDALILPAPGAPEDQALATGFGGLARPCVTHTDQEVEAQEFATGSFLDTDTDVDPARAPGLGHHTEEDSPSEEVQDTTDRLVLNGRQGDQ